MLPDDLDGWIGPIKTQAKSLSQGFAQLPYLVAGTPVDLAELALRPFGYNAEKPIGGSAWLIDKARQYGMLPEASLDAPGAESLGSLLASFVDPATGAAKTSLALEAVLPILAARPIVGRLGHSEPLYSTLGEAVRTRLPDSGPSQQMLGTLRNTTGVTKAELEDARILPRFEEPVVRKQDLRDELEMNMPRLERRVVNYDRVDPNGNGFSPRTKARRLVAYQYPDHPDLYTSPHFTDRGGELSQNLVAHALVGDRSTNGRNYLHVEELQSDLHQSGREFGYDGDPDAYSKFEDINEEFETASSLAEELRDDLKLSIRDLIQDPAVRTDIKPEDEIMQQWADDSPDWFDDINENARAQAVAAALERQGRTREAQDLRKLEADFTAAEYESWRLYDRVAPYEEDGFPPRYPMAGNWDEVVLKDLIKLAAKYGYDGITINQSPVLTRRWGENTAGGMKLYYDQRAPQALNRLGRKYGVKAEPDAYDSETPVWRLDFNDQAREGFRTQQLPQYARGGAVRARGGELARAR